MKEEIRLSMTPQQRRIADQLAPYFGMRSGTTFAFALMTGMISEQDVADVAASLIDSRPDLAAELPYLALTIGPARE